MHRSGFMRLNRTPLSPLSPQQNLPGDNGVARAKSRTPIPEGQHPSVSSTSRFQKFFQRATEQISQNPSQENYLNDLKAWASEGEHSEQRHLAVKKIKTWLRQNNNDIPLDLSGLGLQSVPLLPDSVKVLDIQDNQIKAIQKLPSSLESLNASNNHIAFIQKQNLKNLSGLNLLHNNLMEIPLEIFNPNVFSLVNLAKNPLSELTRRNLMSIRSQDGYTGPQIYFDQSNNK